MCIELRQGTVRVLWKIRPRATNDLQVISVDSRNSALVRFVDFGNLETKQTDELFR